MSAIPKELLIYHSVIRNTVALIFIILNFSLLHKFESELCMYRYEINLDYFPKNLIVHKIDDIRENSIVLNKVIKSNSNQSNGENLYDVICYRDRMVSFINTIPHFKKDLGHLVENWWISYKIYYAVLWVFFLIFSAVLFSKSIIFLNFSSIYTIRLIGADVDYTKRYLRGMFSNILVNFLLFIILLSVFLLFSSGLEIGYILELIIFFTSVIFFYVVKLLVFRIEIKKL